VTGKPGGVAAPPAAPPPDDASIPNTAIVWRRITREQYSREEHRPTSAAFCDSSDGTPMSATMPPDDLSAADYAKTWGAFGVAALTVGQLRALGLGVTRIPADIDPYHVGVHGKKTGKCRNGLKKTCSWVHEPSGD
jgi:hypothetical protein